MPDTSTDHGLTRGGRAAAVFRPLSVQFVPFGDRGQTGRDELARVLVSLRASLVHDVAPDGEIVHEAVALALTGAHTSADREETETLLLTLRSYLAARMERAAVLGRPVRSDGRLAAARRVLGQSLEDAAFATDMVTRLSAAIRDMSDIDASANTANSLPTGPAPALVSP
ncbi:hypothetical protein [Streptomyces sp. NPDC050428]|uniref:hypothetical protein n=1 Tax=Streptomyces sp. NPDC050428 TaxID=3155757 RepID=UPI003422DC65